MKGSTILPKNMVIKEEPESNIKEHTYFVDDCGNIDNNLGNFENRVAESENCSEKIESYKYMDYPYSSPIKTNFSSMNKKLYKMISFDNEEYDRKRSVTCEDAKNFHKRYDSGLKYFKK